MRKKIRTSCPICKKSKNFYLVKKDSLLFYKCNKCGHVIQPVENLRRLKKLVIVSFIILLMLSGGCRKQQPDAIHNYYITFRLNADSPVNYIFEFNHSEIKSGVLESSWNDIKLRNKGGEYIIYYWDDGHYVNYLKVSSYDPNRNKTITRELKLNNKKGKIDVMLSPKIEPDKEQQVNLIFNGTTGYFAYCLYRTVGIISAEPLKNSMVCDSQWTNHTEYGELTNKQYRCNKFIWKCENVNGNECFYDKISIPLNINADECYLVSKVLREEEYEIPLIMKTMDYYDEYDHLNVFIIDMELSNKKRIMNKGWGYEFNEIIFEGELK